MVLKNQKGWLLFDAMVAIVFLALALLSLQYAYSYSVKAAVSARNYNTAISLAQQVAEEFRKNDGIATAATFDAALPADTIPNPQTIKGVQFTITTEKINDLSIADPTIVAYKITVSWEEAAGNSTIAKSLYIINYYTLASA